MGSFGFSVGFGLVGGILVVYLFELLFRDVVVSICCFVLGAWLSFGCLFDDLVAWF